MSLKDFIDEVAAEEAAEEPAEKAPTSLTGASPAPVKASPRQKRKPTPEENKRPNRNFYKGKSSKRGKPPGLGMVKDPATRAARAQVFTALHMRKISKDDIAVMHNVSRREVTKELQWARDNGLVEQVRDRLIGAAVKAPNVYDRILSMTAEEITEGNLTKALDVQRRAAKDLAEGLGMLGVEKVKTTQTIDLDDYHKLRLTRQTTTTRPMGAAAVVDAEPTAVIDVPSGDDDGPEHLES